MPFLFNTSLYLKRIVASPLPQNSCHYSTDPTVPVSISQVTSVGPTILFPWRYVFNYFVICSLLVIIHVVYYLNFEGWIHSCYYSTDTEALPVLRFAHIDSSIWYWCVLGTKIHSSVVDLSADVHFLSLFKSNVFMILMKFGSSKFGQTQLLIEQIE